MQAHSHFQHLDPSLYTSLVTVDNTDVYHFPNGAIITVVAVAGGFVAITEGIKSGYMDLFATTDLLFHWMDCPF